MFTAAIGILGTLLKPFAGFIVAGLVALWMRHQGAKQQQATTTNQELTKVITDDSTREKIDEQVAASAPILTDQKSGSQLSNDGKPILLSTGNDSVLAQWTEPPANY